MKPLKYLRGWIGLSALILLSGCGGVGGDGGGGGDGDGTGASILEVANASTSTSDICNVYSNPSSSDSWGSNRLSGTIPPGTYASFSTSNCNINYDLKVVFCDGYADEVDGYYRACGATRRLTFRNY